MRGKWTLAEIASELNVNHFLAIVTKPDVTAAVCSSSRKCIKMNAAVASFSSNYGVRANVHVHPRGGHIEIFEMMHCTKYEEKSLSICTLKMHVRLYSETRIVWYPYVQGLRFDAKVRAKCVESSFDEFRNTKMPRTLGGQTIPVGWN